jgi:hypothetical protein
MSQQQRQQNLYGVQDWKTIYQTFRDADFKSYDYETLRKSMIDFLRLYNPENFNDYINSSEFVALIDLISFMGQSLSFRMDLNARENYLETARRRDSVLRLSNLVNYVPKRNIAASGLLRIETIRTNEVVTDALGNILSNVNINWNDRNNPNWLEQWNTVMNAAITSSQRVGRPGHSADIDGIQTSEYTLDMPAGLSAPFRYTATVNNTTMPFEAVNPTVSTGVISEYGSNINTIFNLLYRDDQQGYGSNNTGYFLYFKQGTLLYERISITESLPSRQVFLSGTGINNNDVWLFAVNADNSLTEWTRVDAVSGATLNYNSINSTVKTVYSVDSRADDAITLVFGDGVFSDIPVGNFISYYRSSVGQSYRITPAEMTNIVVNIPYLSKTGRNQVLTVTASLKYTVANSAARDTLSDIKIKAPQNYYTQNRMVNGQDYNSFPFVKYNNIVKIKAVNRMSSGVSRYLDVIDETGRFSSTNIVCDDGYLYNDPAIQQSGFTFTNRNDITEKVNTLVLPAVSDASMLAFFYNNYAAQDVSSYNINWNLVLAESDTSSGYISRDGQLLTTQDPVFYEYTGINKFKVGAILKFVPPAGKIFNYDNRLVNRGPSLLLNQKEVLYATVKSISYLGRGNQSGTTPSTQGRDTNGSGAIILSIRVPTGAVLQQVWPTFTPLLPSDIQNQLVDKLSRQQNVGLVYTAGSSSPDSAGSWSLMDNPTPTANYVEPVPGQAAPLSYEPWLMAFVLTGSVYTVYQRSLRYYMGSERQTRFFYDPTVKIYDPASGKLLKDRIDVLKTNSVPTLNTNLGYGTDISIGIYNQVIQNTGFLDNTKIQVTFADLDNNGVPDQPSFYTDIVGTASDPSDASSYVFFVDDQANSGSSMLVLSAGTVKLAADAAAIDSDIYSYSNNDIVFAYNTQVFYQITRNADTVSRTAVNNYQYRRGRQNIKFQYQHNAPADRRIDPSPSNIIDIYVLEKSYADDYLLWIRDYTGTVAEPAVPSTESLRSDFADLENYRMTSDLIIYSPATFKPLFGSKADVNLTAKFVVVKNVNVIVSDSEVKSQVIAKINDYFNVDNWDFGETFYFSDLAAYLHTELSSIISSVHLVPTSTGQVYGDLQQITCLPNEILTSAATVLDVEVVTNLTNVVLRVGI